MELTQLTLYFLTALLIQALLLIFMKKQDIGTRYLYLLGACFVTSNLTLLATTLTDPSNALALELQLRFRYVLLFVYAACFLSYAMQVCNNIDNNIIRQIENGLWIVAFCGAILSIATDEIVTGYRPLQIGITAIPGSSHWVALLHGLMALITSAVILAREWINLDDEDHKKHLLFTLIAYGTHAIVSASVILMLQYGSEINLTITFPLSATLALSLIVYGNFKFGWHTISKSNAVTQQSEVSEEKQLMDIFTTYVNGDCPFNEATEKFELLLLSHAYGKHDGNMMKTAKAMGLGRSTLYKKIQKYKLKEG